MSIKLDKIDKHILQVLQRDGKIQNIELAKEVGLSPSPCLRRVRLLEESGVITRYVAVLDGSMVDAGLSLFARIWFRAQDAETIEEFVKAIKVLLAQGGLTEGGQLARLDAVDGLRHQLGWGVGSGRGGDLFMLAAFADHCHGLVFGVCAGAQGQQGDTQQSARVVRCVHVAC